MDDPQTKLHKKQRTVYKSLSLIHDLWPRCQRIRHICCLIIEHDESTPEQVAIAVKGLRTNRKRVEEIRKWLFFLSTRTNSGLQEWKVQKLREQVDAMLKEKKEKPCN